MRSMKSRAVKFVGGVAVAAALAASAVAAPITWGSATNIGTDASSLTVPDTLVIGGTNYGGSAVTVTSTNPDITFGAPGGVSQIAAGGPTNFADGTIYPTQSDPEFAQVLRSFSSAANPLTLQLNGLSSGARYIVQIFVADQRVGINRSVSFVDTSGGTASGAVASTGQYILGSFKADATTQTITINPVVGGRAFLNGLVLLQRTPEINAAAGLIPCGFLALALLMYSDRRRRAMACTI